FTGAEARAWGGELPTGAPGPTYKRRFPLTEDAVRHVGDPFAVVVAADRYLARDAADLVEADYEDLPVVVDARKAMEPGAPLLFPEYGTNIAARIPMGDKDATDAAFRDADVTISQWMVNHRLIPNPMEPRGVIA